ncbi:MAG: WG repeat-containing protein [Defluviitaleaceae bacterium]|nr:WG repeat-containing protein [Defluviitaleaceae bacterium]
MNKSIKIITMLFSISFLALTGFRFANIETMMARERAETIAMAQMYIEHGIYQRAVPIVINLISTETNPNTEANMRYSLMRMQYSLGNMRLYRETLEQILNIGISPNSSSIASLYLELYYFHYYGRSNIRPTIDLLRRAYENTSYEKLGELFENYRFHYTIRNTNFDYIGIPFGNNILVSRQGYYGMVNLLGVEIRAPQFEFATNFVGNYAVVQRDGVLEIINRSGIRQAIADFNVTSLSSFNGRTFVYSVEDSDGYFLGYWPQGSLTFYSGNTELSFIGALTEGIRVSRNFEGLYSVGSDFIFNSIAIDRLGRAAVNGRIFTNSGNSYEMRDLNGTIIAEGFEKAMPFFEENGLAAVKRNGYWGLISASGNIVLDFQNESLKSSSMGFVPIKINGYWGYLTLDGFRVVIEPRFYEAWQFVDGMATIHTERGLGNISLTAY